VRAEAEKTAGSAEEQPAGPREAVRDTRRETA
jgi:hypothetical protein